MIGKIQANTNIVGILSCAGSQRYKSNFTKRLGVYSYKIKKPTFKLYSNPHLVPLKVREMLSKKKELGNLKLREIARRSQRPFGYFTSKGRFHMQIEKVPLYDIPDIKNCELKPYVEWKSPKIPEQDKVEKQVTLTQVVMEDIRKQFESQGLLPEFEKIKEYFDKISNKRGAKNEH